MNLERLLIVTVVGAGVAGLLAMGYVAANATRQGDGTLVQEPMHLGSTVSPNFIMAIDDSGSMTFQTMFPGQDGEACWSGTSFFDGTNLRTSGSCDYLYVLPGVRINNYNGIPPFDKFGFARSPDYNPTYYSPDVTYEPWIKADLTSYGNASVTATPLDPRNATPTVDLFGTVWDTTTNGDFRLQDGMVIPSGIRFARTVPESYQSWECIETDRRGRCTKEGYVTRTRDVYIDSTTTAESTWAFGAKDVFIEYKPAVFFLKTNRTMDGYTAGVEVTNACGTGCSLWKYEPNSATTKQNFANWFAYYGNRNRAMVAGLTRSLKDVTKLRVGYFTINSGAIACAKDADGKVNDTCYTNYQPVSMLDMDSTDDKKTLLGKVIPLPANGSTPNRFAVNHIGDQFANNANIIQNACQKNAGMLFTDGYSNQDGPAVGNQDGTLTVPFVDSYSDTLADIAAKYYNTQLRSNTYAAGKVPTTNPQICESGSDEAKKGQDCNKNLHMNFYGITLGARGKQFGVNWGVGTDGKSNGALATQQALASATAPAWEKRTNDNPNTVDEIWHATMNARGSYINAQTPADITNAMRNVLASVGVGGGVSGSLAITGSRLGDASLSVTPRFSRNGTDWYGDVVASKPSRTRNASNQTVFTYTTTWTASQELPAAADRRLYYGVTSSDTTPTVARFYDNGPGALADLCANYAAGCGPMPSTSTDSLKITIEEARHYLAGDRSLEGTKLRTRTHPLGDIINSTPVVAAPTDDFGYALLRKGDTFEYDPYDYNTYLNTKKTRKRSVFVGANDGMLHAFHGDTGKEQFAYIPATAVGYMGNLLFPTSPDFQHRYYVDGPVIVSDARLNGSWKTVLVGTAGAGGRGVFGLDVSTPGSFAATDVLWEVNDKVDGAVGNRIGYVLGKPVIVPVRGSDGTPVWKAIFGGGYANRLQDSATTIGTATLFIVDMASGDVEYIDARETGATVANGLGNIVAIDRKQYNSTARGYVQGSDGMVDTVYGGDLQGNVWKFDLTASGTDRVALGNKPLFTAAIGNTRQAITGGFEAAVGPRGGVMLLFGTGSFSFDGDKENKGQQTIYGVLDMPGEATSALPLKRSNLQVQTMDNNGGITNTTVNYFLARGWYVDLAVTTANGLTLAGERAVGYPKLEGGTLYITSYAPTAGDACSGGGSNYLYALSTLSGGGMLGAVKVGSPDGSAMAEGTGRMTLVGDGSAPIKDVSVFTTGKEAGLSGTPDDAAIANYDAMNPEYCMAIVSVAGSQPLYRVRPCGRQSWRQIR